MSQFGLFVSWQNYLDVQITLAERDETEAENELKQEEAEFMVRSNKKHNEKLNERRNDPAVKSARDRYEVLHARRKMLQSISGGLERNASFLSRELTRRTESPYEKWPRRT